MRPPCRQFDDKILYTSSPIFLVAFHAALKEAIPSYHKGVLFDTSLSSI